MLKRIIINWEMNKIAMACEFVKIVALATDKEQI